MKLDLTPQSLGDPEEGEDREAEGGPVDEGRGGLVSEDGEESPGDGNRSGDVTLLGGEGIGDRSRLKEEQGQEDEDVSEDTGLVGLGIDAESLESGKKDEDSRPSMPETEGEVDPELVV